MSWLSEAKNKFITWPLMARVALFFFVIGFLFGGLTCRTWRKAIIEDQPPSQVAEIGSFGWVDRPDHVNAVVSTFKHPYFGDVAKNIIQQDVDKDALLYKIYEKVTGHPWRPHDQDGTGSCVAHGGTGGGELLTATQIAAGEDDRYEPLSAAALYGVSREIGGMLRGGDGSTGADCAKAMMQFGFISSKDAGDDNYNTAIGAKLCKQWGRSGVPKEFHKFARKVQTASRVRTPEEVRTAIVNGYPVTIASSVGFEGKGGHKRDADGFCYSGGTWAHQMFIGAYRADKKAFLVFNSWGPRMPEGPKSLDQPDGTFWITWKDMQRITSSGEAYAISGFDGFPRQNIDNFIAQPNERRDQMVRRSLSPLVPGHSRIRLCFDQRLQPSWF